MVSKNSKIRKKGMVSIEKKKETSRYARAVGFLSMKKKTFQIFLKDGSPKGDVFEVARVAGMMAAKQTPQIIPHCHPILLNYVHIDFGVDKRRQRVKVIAEVSAKSRTGVEMEALVAVTTAALTIYDMMKWMDAAMDITGVRLVYKSGGKSGIFQQDEEE